MKTGVFGMRRRDYRVLVSKWSPW